MPIPVHIIKSSTSNNFSPSSSSTYPNSPPFVGDIFIWAEEAPHDKLTELGIIKIRSAKCSQLVAAATSVIPFRRLLLGITYINPPPLIGNFKYSNIH